MQNHPIENPCTTKGGVAGLNVNAEKIITTVTNVIYDPDSNTDSNHLWGNFAFQGHVLNNDDPDTPIFVEFKLGTEQALTQQIRKQERLFQLLHASNTLTYVDKKPLAVHTKGTAPNGKNQLICNFNLPQTAYHLLRYGLNPAPDGTAPFDLSLVTNEAHQTLASHLQTIEQKAKELQKTQTATPTGELDANANFKTLSILADTMEDGIPPTFEEMDTQFAMYARPSFDKHADLFTHRELATIVMKLRPDIYNQLLDNYNDSVNSSKYTPEEKEQAKAEFMLLGKYEKEWVNSADPERPRKKPTDGLFDRSKGSSTGWFYRTDEIPHQVPTVALNLPSTVYVGQRADSNATVIKAVVHSVENINNHGALVNGYFLSHTAIDPIHPHLSDQSLLALQGTPKQHALNNWNTPSHLSSQEKTKAQIAHFEDVDKSNTALFFSQFTTDLSNIIDRQQERNTQYQQSRKDSAKEGEVLPDVPFVPSNEHLTLQFSTLSHREYTNAKGQTEFLMRQYDAPLPTISFTDFSPDNLSDLVQLKHPRYLSLLEERQKLQAQFDDRFERLNTLFGDIRTQFGGANPEKNATIRNFNTFGSQVDPRLSAYSEQYDPNLAMYLERHEQGFELIATIRDELPKQLQDTLAKREQEKGRALNPKEHAQVYKDHLIQIDNFPAFQMADRNQLGYANHRDTSAINLGSSSLQEIVAKQAMIDLEIMKYETMAFTLNTPLVHKMLVEKNIITQNERAKANDYQGVSRDSPVWGLFGKPFGDTQEQQKGATQWHNHPLTGIEPQRLFDLSGKDLNPRNIFYAYMRGFNPENTKVDLPKETIQAHYDHAKAMTQNNFGADTKRLLDRSHASANDEVNEAIDNNLLNHFKNDFNLGATISTGSRMGLNTDPTRGQFSRENAIVTDENNPTKRVGRTAFNSLGYNTPLYFFSFDDYVNSGLKNHDYGADKRAKNLAHGGANAGYHLNANASTTDSHQDYTFKNYNRHLNMLMGFQFNPNPKYRDATIGTTFLKHENTLKVVSATPMTQTGSNNPNGVIDARKWNGVNSHTKYNPDLVATYSIMGSRYVVQANPKNATELVETQHNINKFSTDLSKSYHEYQKAYQGMPDHERPAFVPVMPPYKNALDGYVRNLPEGQSPVIGHVHINRLERQNPQEINQSSNTRTNLPELATPMPKWGGGYQVKQQMLLAQKAHRKVEQDEHWSFAQSHKEHNNLNTSTALSSMQSAVINNDRTTGQRIRDVAKAEEKARYAQAQPTQDITVTMNQSNQSTKKAPISAGEQLFLDDVCGLNIANPLPLESTSTGAITVEQFFAKWEAQQKQKQEQEQAQAQSQAPAPSPKP